jgi:F0F1-type ATP synthase membrane subunit c/vacuolar-type H+-ATPase subunit K
MENNSAQQPPKKRKLKSQDIWIGLGIAIGVGLGTALGNPAIGIGIGISAGVAINLWQKRKQR